MRNNALDAAKLLACFFIIVVHSGGYQEYQQPFGELFRVSSRWALPFFFLASGYMMGLAEKDDLGRKINKLVSILFWASVVYIPIIFRMSGGDIWRIVGKIVSNDTLQVGTFFHLWFINALILGVILTNYFLKNVGVKLSLFISYAILVACWYGDLVKSLHYDIYIYYALRTLIAFSLVYLGHHFAKHGTLINIPNKISISVFCVSIALMVVETYTLGVLYKADMMEKQFPLFVIPACIALLSISVNANLKENIISKFGRDYSLGIYLIHPFIQYLLIHDFGYYIANNSTIKLFISFVSSIALLALLKLYLPQAYRKLNGIGIK